MYQFEIFPLSYVPQNQAWHSAWLAFSENMLIENFNITEIFTENEDEIRAIRTIRTKILREKYNAIFTVGLSGSRYLVFDTQEDMMAFILEWS